MNNSGRIIDCPARMSEVISRFGIVPFFKGAVPGWSVEEMTAPGCWFDEGPDSVELGPWDWKIDVVREGGIAYGKFLGGKAAFVPQEIGEVIHRYEVLEIGALDKLRKAQRLVGGKLVLVEREADRPKLLDFYNTCGFKSWNGRYDKKDQVQYDQMIRVLESVA